MRKLTKLSILFVLVLGCAASYVIASMVYVAPEVALDEAELIVVATLTKADGEKGTGTLTVTQVLKGKKETKTIEVKMNKTVKVQAGRPQMAFCGGPRTFRQGTEGIWVFKKKVDGSYHLQQYCTFINKSAIEKTKKTLAKLSKAEWTKAVDGLKFKVLVHMMNESTRNPMLYIAAKNVSNKTIYVNEFQPDKPLTITVGDPDDNEKNIDLYKYLENNNHTPKITKRNFRKIEPGQLAYICIPYGIGLSSTITKNGTYAVEVTYQNTKKYKDNKTLKDAKISNVWTGKIKIPAVEYKVNAKPLPKRFLRKPVGR